MKELFHVPLGEYLGDQFWVAAQEVMMSEFNLSFVVDVPVEIVGPQLPTEVGKGADGHQARVDIHHLQHAPKIQLYPDRCLQGLGS